MRRGQNTKIKIKPKYAIIVDGECEFWYIQMLKRNENLISVDLKPEIPQRKALSEQFDKVVELSKDYDKVYWVIDFDVVCKETREAKKNKKTALQELKEYINTLKKKFENIIVVIINNPCFEYWLLLHFEMTSRLYSSYNELIRQLKKYLPDYEKSRRYYTSLNNDIYLRLASKLPVAIINANKLKEFDLDNPNVGVSQMNIFFEEVLPSRFLDKSEGVFA